MLRKVFVAAAIVFILAALALSGLQPASAADFSRAYKTTNRIAGVWEGKMSFTDSGERKEDIVVAINPGCKPGDICGSLQNLTVSCTWELKYIGTKNSSFVFIHSQTLSGECPHLGTGYYRLAKDGRLYRQHITPLFTAYGWLTPGN